MKQQTISNAGTDATIVPARGGLVTRLAVGGREILFLDRHTFENRSEHVRGGIPILFPFAGRLVDRRLIASDTHMDLHGFARDLEWTVEEHLGDSHRMFLEAGAEILAHFPFPHRLTQATRVSDGSLTVTLDIENRGSDPMPVAPGWHPYFCCPGDQKTAVSYELSDFPYHQLSNETYDFGLEPPAASTVDFDIPAVGAISLSFSPEFRHLQFWTLPERDFICVEPWDGPADVINSERRRLVSPGESLVYWMSISLKSPGS